MDEFDEMSDADIEALTEMDEMGKVIRAIPGIGTNRAKEFMLANSIADNRRVGGLSEHRRAQVIALGGER